MAKPKEINERKNTIVRTSIIAIMVNILLVVFKALVGMMTNSIAIILDAVNNLADAMASVITIVGTKLAGKAPDKKHPYGYGRLEYVSATIIAFIVLYAGVTSLIESVKSIIHPETSDYSMVSLLIITVAVIVKLLLGRFVKRVGERVNSESLVDSGTEALMDAIVSTSTIVAAIIYISTGISLEAWLAAIISLMIIKSGIEMLGSTLSQILGERTSKELISEIKKVAGAYDEVHGVHDLTLNNYGPDTHIGSLHVEVEDTMTAIEIDDLTRRIQKDVFTATGVFVSAVGIYSINTRDPEAIEIRHHISEIAIAHTGVVQIHGFYLNKVTKTISFDLIIAYEVKDRERLYQEIREEVKAAYPEYDLVTALDIDAAD